MRSALVVLLLTAGAWADADGLGSGGNDAGRVNVNDALPRAEVEPGDPDTPADLNGDNDIDPAGRSSLAAQGSQAACPVVINEVLAHAHAAAPDWIELYNAGNTPVNIGGWTLSDRQNDLDKFRIAADTVLQPFGYVVFYENTDFGNAQNPDTHTPFALTENGETLYLASGKLDNASEDLYLLKPGDVDAEGTRYWIEVDSLSYSDGRHPKGFPTKVDPWPTAADGSGPGLSRLLPRKYGNDQNNWHAAPPTPGRANN